MIDQRVTFVEGSPEFSAFCHPDDNSLLFLLKLLRSSSSSSPLFSSSAALLRGDLDSALEVLEEVFTRPDGDNPSMSFVFRKVFEEENDKAVDKCKKAANSLHTACV